jgi:endoglucanase
VNWLTYGNTISGKAIDDRLGCFCLIETARRLAKTNQQIYYVFTVQEEVGVQGAKTSAFAIHPRWAIVIDVTVANDLSYDDEKTAGTHLTLGKGPCILHMEEGFIPNTDLVTAIRKAAEKHNIPIQHEVSSFGTTDASNISAVRRGVPSANISIAIRNVHSTIEIANRKDVENTITLVTNLMKDIPASLKKPHTDKKKETTVVKRPHKPQIRKKPGKSPKKKKSTRKRD